MDRHEVVRRITSGGRQPELRHVTGVGYLAYLGETNDGTVVGTANDKPSEWRSYTRTTLTQEDTIRGAEGVYSFKSGDFMIAVDEGARTLHINGKPAHTHEFPYNDGCK